MCTDSGGSARLLSIKTSPVCKKTDANASVFLRLSKKQRIGGLSSGAGNRIGPMTRVDKNDPNYIWYSPVEADSFSGLPPAYIETAEFDCLHDDGILYAQLLREAGIDVTLNETKGTMHGFDIAAKAPTTLAAMEQRIAFMKRMI